MSRHRNVRSLNYEEECDGYYDDVYGHSVEDDLGVSPSTAAEFMYDRSQQHVLSTFMRKEHEPNIPEEDVEDEVPLQMSSFSKPVLDDIQQAQLYSCLEQLRDIVGDSTPEPVLIDAIVKTGFDANRALDFILCLQEAPKPQREPRKRKERDACNNSVCSLSADFSLTNSTRVQWKCFESDSTAFSIIDKTTSKRKKQSELILWTSEEWRLGKHALSPERQFYGLNPMTSLTVAKAQSCDSLFTMVERSTVHEHRITDAECSEISFSERTCFLVGNSLFERDHSALEKSCVGLVQGLSSGCSLVNHVAKEDCIPALKHVSVSHLTADSDTPLKSSSFLEHSCLSHMAADHETLSKPSSSQKPINLSHLAVSLEALPKSGSQLKFISLSPLAVNHETPPKSGSSQKSISLSHLAADHETPPKSESSLKPINLAADHETPPKSGSSQKPISLSHLAADHETSSKLGSSQKSINLSHLAADQEASPKSGSSQKPISLSHLVADHETPPKSDSSLKPINLSHLAADHETSSKLGSSQKPISLSHLAADHETSSKLGSSQKSINLSHLAADQEASPKSGSSQKPISLSHLVADHETPPKSGSSKKPVTLSHLAASHESPPKSGSSQNPLSLSHLAADHETPPKSDSSLKPINLSHLAAGHETLSKLGSSKKPVTLLHLAASHESPPKSGSSQKPISLSHLAASHETPPKSGSPLKPINLAHLAADHETSSKSSSSQKSVSLSHLAADPETLSKPGFSKKPVTLSHLAADHETPPKSDSPLKPINLSHLAAGHEASPKSGSSQKPISLSHLAADHEACSKMCSSSRLLGLSNWAEKHESSADSFPRHEHTNSWCLRKDLPDVVNSSGFTKPLSLSGLAQGSGSQTMEPSPPTHFMDNQLPSSSHPLSLSCVGQCHTSPKNVTYKCNELKKYKPGSFNLSDLAAKHEVYVPKSKRNYMQKCADPTVGPSIAKPSLFAKTLCTIYAKIQINGHKMGPKKFHYTRSIKHRAHVVNFDIRPFDFSTPSPDDIVKTKQKAAFGSSNRAKVLADKVDSSTNGTNKLADTITRVTPGAGADVTQGVARLTFSATANTTMGFVEPEKTDEMKEKSEKDAREKTPDNTVTKNTADNIGAMSDGTPKKETTDTSVSKPITRSKQERQEIRALYDKRQADNKAHLNLVVVGHVDAGKSTLMGHVLYQLGFVNKRVMHKHEQEAKKMGKASFAYAWVLDETEEERSRGVTMDIAQRKFDTETKMITLLDAPGHKDFIPNMITGAAQADVAILVVNATRGEFETGFDMGGQTREHAMLIRSLGVSQILVAVNKMDTVDWSKARYDEIVKKLGTFLKQAGFKEADVNYVPCSGLIGENLTKPCQIPELTSWYHGSYLVQQIDQFRPPERIIDKPLRLSITDIFKGQGAGFSVAGTIQAGCVQSADKVLVMPQAEVATVRGVIVDDNPAQMAFAGDTVILTLVGIQMTNIGIGSIVCDRSEPIRASTRFQARVVIFNIDIPITKGFPVEVHYQSLTEPGLIRRLISQLNKSTGEVIKKKPRCLTKNSNAIVEIEVERPICVELYRDYKDLGRIMLRSGGHTIAAGLVTEVINEKKNN